MRLFLLSSAISVALSAPVLAQTQSTPEDEIIVTGVQQIFGVTKSETPILEVPRSVSVVTSEEFLEKGSLSLGDTVNYTAGVVSNSFGFATRGDFFNVRGLDAPEYQDNLQVLFGFYNNTRADIYTLERVEVLKGPASVLYGQAAPGGIVSTVSKVANRDRLNREIVLSAGTNDRYQVSGDAGFDLSGDGTVTARLVGLYRDSGTQIDYVDDDALVFAPSITYQTDRATLTGLINYTKRDGDTAAQFVPLMVSGCADDSVTFSDRAVCTGSTGAQVEPSAYFGDPNFNKYDTQSTTVSVFGTYQINEFLSFEGTARYRDAEADYQQTWFSFAGAGTPRANPDGTPTIGRTWSDAFSTTEQYAFDARMRASFNTGPVNHEILGGMNYQEVKTADETASIYGYPLLVTGQPSTFSIFNPVYDGSEIPPQSVFDAARGTASDETTATDFYITDTMNVGRLVLNAGIRFSSVKSEDGVTTQDDDETPITLGALYRTDFGLNPYVSYSESFRATVGTDSLTNSPLRPRAGEQFEVGLKYQPPGSQSYITAAYFDLEEDNLVEFIAGGQTQPGQSIMVEGFEVEAYFELGDFSVDADFVTLDGKDVDPSGVETTRSSLPETTVSVWGRWEPTSGPLENFRVGTGVRHASSVQDEAGTLKIVTDGYTVFDGLLGYTLGEVDLSLNARNIFDKTYYSTCLTRGDCFAAEGRTVVATAAYRF